LFVFTICSEMTTSATAVPEMPLIERQLQMLGELAELGLEIARAIEAKARTPEADLDAAAMAYARVARAVRQSILLQSRLLADAQELEEKGRFARYCRRRDRKESVERIVRRVAWDACGDDREAEAIAREVCEGLEHDDIYGDVATRPIGELVALICRDLGLEPDWAAFADEAWAQAEMRSGAEGSPFHGLLGPCATTPKAGGGRCASASPVRDSS
jgi:hypothetical protein